MARDRQRAKQRQQARREQRLAQRRAEGAQPPTPEPDTEPADPEVESPPAETEAEARAAERYIEEEADLDVGAPPQDLGTSEATLQSEASVPDVEADPNHLEAEEIAEEEEFEEEHPDDFVDEEHPRSAPVRRHREHGRDREHGKVIGFLVNVWAELQRVQWPDRQAVTTLTGVVLGFVLIAGGYLGLLDALFSRVIKAIL